MVALASAPHQRHLYHYTHAQRLAAHSHKVGHGGENSAEADRTRTRAVPVDSKVVNNVEAVPAPWYYISRVVKIAANIPNPFHMNRVQGL